MQNETDKKFLKSQNCTLKISQSKYVKSSNKHRHSFKRLPLLKAPPNIKKTK